MILKANPNQKFLTASVMAHPSREKFFPYLRIRLGIDTPFAVDEDGGGVWPTCRKAWALSVRKDSLYHVVIQDDAIVCEDFYERATEAIMGGLRRFGSDLAFSFYFGRRGNLTPESEKALARGWTTRVSPTWGVAICLPTHLILPMIEYADKLNHKQDDYRIGSFLRHRKIRTYFPMPSLVDHRIHTESLVGDPGRGRCAYKFIDT